VEQTLQKIISVSTFEAYAATRLGELVVEPLLCVAIGEAEIARLGGLGSAVTRCTSDVLPDVLLAALWCEVPAARPVVAQMDALLGQRQINGEVGCA
jgi:hypothetical protein